MPQAAVYQNKYNRIGAGIAARGIAAGKQESRLNTELAGNSIKTTGRTMQKDVGSDSAGKNWKELSNEGKLKNQKNEIEKIGKKILESNPYGMAISKTAGFLGVDIIKIFKWLAIINFIAMASFYIFISLIVVYLATHTWEAIKMGFIFT